MGVHFLLCRSFSWNRKRLALPLSRLREWRRIILNTLCHIASASWKANVLHGGRPWSVFPARTSCRLEVITNWQRNRICHVYIVLNCCHILQRDYGLLSSLHLFFVLPKITLG